MRPLRATAVLAVALATGCISTTDPVSLGPEPGVAYDPGSARPVEGRGCGYYTFGGASGIYAKALKNLEREAPFAYLTEFKVQPYWRWILVGALQCVRLTATAYDVVTPPAPETAGAGSGAR